MTALLQQIRGASSGRICSDHPTTEAPRTIMSVLRSTRRIPTMGEIINLHSTPIDLNTDLGHSFVVDCCRAGEGLCSDQEIIEKYELSPADWTAICKDKSLGNMIRAERERRVRSGQAVREASAKALIKGPGILDQIMSGPDSHPKHKIEAFKELRQTASIGTDAEGQRDSDRFIISIVLTADGAGPEVVEHYNKSIEVNPNDVDPNDIKINLDEDHAGK